MTMRMGDITNDHERQQLRRKAHERLDRLCDEMEADQGHGKVGVTCEYEAGIIRIVRRVVDGTDKGAK